MTPNGSYQHALELRLKAKLNLLEIEVFEGEVDLT